MAIRQFFFLSFAAAGVVTWGTAPSAKAQQAHPPVPTPPHQHAADGLILSADDFMLAPGETLVESDPGVKILPAPQAAHPAHAGHPPHPGVLDGHQPMFPPESEMAIGMPCPSCEPGHYAIAEALYVKHDEERYFGNSPTSTSGEEFDYEWAGRITLGRRFDCVNGYEVVYTGPFDWEMRDRINFVDAGSGTNLATDQRFQAEMNSVELNRTYHGWDVVKASLGLRGVLYEEEAAFGWNGTFEGAPSQGTLRQEVDNFLIGPQAGLEMYYPLSNRVFVGSKLKGAVFANFVDAETRLVDIDAGTTSGGSEDDVDLAGMVEIGSHLGMHLTECITITGGYDMWYLMGVATAYDRGPRFVEAGNAEADEEVLMHGFTAGVQVSY